MSTLLERLDDRVAERRSSLWAYYAELIRTQPDGGESDLEHSMRELGLSVDDVRQHEAVVREMQELREQFAQREQLEASLEDAAKAHNEAARNLEDRVRELEADLVAKEGKVQMAHRELIASKKAAERLRDLEHAYPFLRDRGKLIPPPPRIDVAELPKLDRRMVLASIDPASVYSAKSLAEIGITPAVARQHNLAALGNDEYAGSVVLAFAIEVWRVHRLRERKDLESELVRRPTPEIRCVNPIFPYETTKIARDMKIPPHWLSPLKRQHEHLGSSLLEWCDLRDEAIAAAEARLKVLAAEERDDQAMLDRELPAEVVERPNRAASAERTPAKARR